MKDQYNFSGAGKTIMSAVVSCFWDEHGQFAKEELADPPETETAFLWPFSAYITMLCSAYKLGASAGCLYTDALKAVEKYRQDRGDGYTAYTAAYGGFEDAYYDDNAWIVDVFLTAYHCLGGKQWLLKAKDAADYCYSGWDDTLGGGVYWRESDKLYKSLCSNAPLALFSAELYRITGDTKYSDWAKKLYLWSKSTFWETDGIYTDGIFLDGTIDKAKYPYNTAFMIRTELSLCRLTDNETYLLNAEFSANKSFGVFFKPDDSGRLKLTERPWFYMCLLEAYIDLHSMSSKKNKLRGYIDFIAGEVIRAYQTCSNENGFVSPDFWLEGGPAPQDIQLRDQSAISNMMFILSEFYRSNGCLAI